MKTKEKVLDANQQRILEKFIIHFFEPTDHKRKTSGNELDYITKTLNKVFIRNFGFNLDRSMVANTFTSLGYNVFHKNQTYKSDTKKFVPAYKGEIMEISYAPFGETELPYTYYNIDTKVVRHLMLSVCKLDENPSTEKRKENEDLRKQIVDFREANQIKISRLNSNKL